MVRLHKLHPEAAQVNGLAVLYHLSLDGAQHVVLLQLVLNQPDGQLCAVHRRRHVLQHVGKGADVILMSVGDHKALDLVNVVLQIGDVWNDQVNAQHVVAGEGQSAVHHNNTVLVLKGRHIHSDLLQASERYNLYLIIFCVLFQINRTSDVLFYLNPHVAHQLVENPGEVIKLAVLLYEFIHCLSVLWF